MICYGLAEEVGRLVKPNDRGEPRARRPQAGVRRLDRGVGRHGKHGAEAERLDVDEIKEGEVEVWELKPRKFEVKR